MTHFVKLYASILDSTIWAEPAPTVKVWLTLLAMADAHGFVDGTLTGVMRRAIVSREECETAIRVLEAPDADSKTPDNEGRRIERLQGGWKILNHRKYRDLRTETQIAVAERVKKHRHTHPKTMLPVTDVTNVTSSNGMKRPVTPEVEVDTEAKTTTTPAVRRNTRFAFMAVIRPVWFDVYGGEIPPGSAKLLEPLVREHGVEEVARRLKIYCESTEVPFASIYKFVSTFGSWGTTSPTGKNGQSPVRARAETLLVAFTRHGFTQNLPLESHERHIQELADAGKVLNPERFKLELLAVKPWTWLGSTREVDREKSISRIAAAIATVAA